MKKVRLVGFSSKGNDMQKEASKNPSHRRTPVSRLLILLDSGLASSRVAACLLTPLRRNDGIGIFSDAQKFVLSVALVFIAMLAAPYSFAQHVAPDTLLKAATADVIAIIRQDEEIQAGTPARVADLVEARILPLFDFTRMTQAAVARNWRFATPAQQKALTTEFTLLLVRTYAASLSSYRDRIIEFKPLRAGSGDTQIKVKSVVKQSGAAPITMNFDMERVAAGWTVYDIKINGLSLISAYRETFAGKVRDGGLVGLIQSITEQNQQGEARFRSLQRDDFYLPVLVWSLLQSRR